MRADVSALRGEIVARPWTAIAIAFAVGACAAVERSGVVRRAVLSSLGAALLEALRDRTGRPWSAAGSPDASDWPSGT